MEEVRLQGSDFSVVSRARLMKWILELDADAFPEVLEELKDLRGDLSTDPFAADSNLPDYLRVALSRWYELEGAGVLDWVLSKPEVLKGAKKGTLIQTLIQDGYARDPDWSFQLVKKYAEAMEAGSGQSGIADSWFYQVGRWSRNVEAEYDELLGLASVMGLGSEE